MSVRRVTQRGQKTLSEKERRFVEAFMGPCVGNATQAAIRSGYSHKSARRIATRLLSTNVHIRHAIDERVSRCDIVADRERLQRFWSAIVEGRGHYATLPMKDRLRASELLARSQAMFVDRIDLNHFDHAKYLADECPTQ